jgi:hypothetical protein
MAATDNFGFRYPTLEDDPNVPQDIKALAEDVDSELVAHGVIVGYKTRTSNSTASASIVRVLSVRAPVRAGRMYRVICDGEIFSSNGAATSQSELRYTTDDSEPTTTSTILSRAIVRHDATTATPDMCHIEGIYKAVSDGWLRVAVTTTRVLGSVNVSWTADPTFPMLLMVVDAGPAITEDGTVY